MDDLSKSFMPSIFILFLICFLSIGLFLKKTSKAIDYRLFLGSLPSLVRNSNHLPVWYTEVFCSLGKGSFFIDGPIFSNLKYLVTCHDKNIEYILKSDFNNFPKGPNFKQIFDPLGDGIFNVDSDAWKLQRRMAHTAFISGEFKVLLSKISRSVVKDQLLPFLVHVTEAGSVIDLQELCSRFAFDVNMKAIFGVHANYLSIELPSNDLAEAVGFIQEAILHRFTMPMSFWKLMPINIINAHFYKYISQKRINLNNGVKTFDLLSSYIDSSSTQEHKTTTTASSSPNNDDKFLRDSMLSLLIAGKDALASGLNWFFWLVSKHPMVEKKILGELKVLMSSKTGKVLEYHEWPWVFDSNDINGLVYLHAALCESLRLYPPVPTNRKTVLKEVVLPDGSLVKPGMKISLAFYSRWIDDDGKLKRYESKFFPFNLGPRTCLGKDMSFTHLKAVAAAVLFNFQVQVLEGQNVRPRASITLLMEKGLEVKIQKRVI
ncbi:hypothetical protein MKW92_042208 [Papaver armeniacum]|nr:hypothetical protein MKW92_042208 [Papaver armeniacum]